ncbi:MAG: lipopolysaccharide heptosyltransferase II [Candidatus Omnitrophica bacterium]|nr:lipopolysaccharide heptosyltransferase II [Candidatus Omnitrophota bacterium]
MNILQVLPELNVGGVETGTVDFAKYLTQHGHKSVVISNGGRLVVDLELNGSKHFSLPVHEKSLFTILAMIRRVRQIILSEKIDIVHARSRVPAWIAFFACRGTNAQFITTCHGYYKTPWFSQIMGWGKLVIVPSEAIGRYMVQEYKVPAHGIRKIPRSVDVERFAAVAQERVRREEKTQKDFVVTIIGRITPLKGHIYFIRAMAKVIRQMPYLKVWIVGDAPADKQSYRRELEVLARQLGLNPAVEFLGSRADIPELLGKTDVLVFASVTPESFGRVIIEAQAAGVPVVATNVGGVVDIIEADKTGLLVPSKDSDAIAKAVLRLYHDRALGRQLTQAAQKKIREQYTIEHMAKRTLAVYQELLDALNLLVIKISSLGDVVLITASLRLIRRHYPQAKIYCLVGKEARPILQNCPYVDELIVYDRSYKDKGLPAFLRLARYLRHLRFDQVIDFQNNRSTHLLAFLTLSQQRYGYDNGKWGFLLNHGLKKNPTPLPAVLHQFEILKKMGISPSEQEELELWPSAKDQRYIEDLLDAEWLGNCRRVVGINVAASEKWETKNWPIESIARLCDLLSAKNIRVVITGTEKDKLRAFQLLQITRAKPANLTGKTDVMQLAALIKRCNVFVTPDSAPLHIAAALRTPCIALFGPTDSRRHVPPGCNLKILDKHLKCAPCYNAHCRIHTRACLAAITPEEVLKEILSLLVDKAE